MVRGWWSDSGGIIQVLVSFNRLSGIGPDVGYYPEESKRKLIVKEKDLESMKIGLEKSECKFIVTFGDRYLGGVIGGL